MIMKHNVSISVQNLTKLKHIDDDVTAWQYEVKISKVLHNLKLMVLSNRTKFLNQWLLLRTLFTKGRGGFRQPPLIGLKQKTHFMEINSFVYTFTCVCSFLISIICDCPGN